MTLHHPRRIPLVAVVALVSALALSSSVHPETPSSTVGLWAIGTDHAASVSSTGYGVVVLNSWDEALIPSIRAAQPGVRILLYQDISSTRSYACRDGVDDALLRPESGTAGHERIGLDGSSVTPSDDEWSGAGTRGTGGWTSVAAATSADGRGA